MTSRVISNRVINRPGVSTWLLGARTVREIEETVGGVGWEPNLADLALVDGYTRSVFDSLPIVPDMFQNWRRWDL